MLTHPGRRGNAVWDGAGVRLFAARNEIVAFQVIVDADPTGIRALSVALPEFRFGSREDRVPRAGRRSQRYRRSPNPALLGQLHACDDAVTRELGVGAEVPSPRRRMRWAGSRCSSCRRTHSPAAAAFPCLVAAGQNQAFWIEIYTGRNRPAGTYQGRLTITADGRRQELPLWLELFDFALPDENTMHAMVYYASDQPELYHGRNMDAAYHRFAHRQRIESVHAYDIATTRAALGRFTGADFTRDAHYEGPGQRCRQHHRPRLLLPMVPAPTTTTGRARGHMRTRG